MPRPTKLNAQRAQQICDYVAQGHTREVAAQACGIVSTTLYRWMKRGERQPDGPYGEFCRALKRADLEAELACLRQIKEAAQNGDWRSRVDARAALPREVGQAAPWAKGHRA